MKEPKRRAPKLPAAQAQCLCGAVCLEIDVPAFWAWHDHSAATRQAHGAAYATYVGVYRSRFRVTAGAAHITCFTHESATRSFCAVCGTPLTYERGHSPKMLNIPRALFATRTGREPRYHIAIDQSPEWAWRESKLVPLKGFPGVVWHRPARRKRPSNDRLPD